MGGTTPREGQTLVGESLLVRYVNFVKLPHTVFALPFALLGLVVASRETALTWRALGLVVLALTCARFVALGSDSIAARAGYVAARGRWSEPWWVFPVGTLAVTFGVAVFDVFYALPDEAFDRSERLESLVVRLAQARAILAGKVLHGLALVALVLFGMGAGLGVAYYVGVAVGAGLIAWEHRLVRPGDLSRLNAAFFGANGLVS